MPVNTLHEEYIKYSEEWQRVEDAVIGSPALRRKNETYLPSKNAKAEPEWYKAYCQSAYYTNYTGRTENVLQGMVFRKPASVNVPPELEGWLDNIDGSGNSLTQLAKIATEQRLRKNRYLFLTDVNSSAKGVSQEEEAALGVRPIIVGYTAEALINWRFAVVDGIKKLVMAVLVESENASDSEFGSDMQPVYRVLRLRDGVYTQQVYDSNLNPREEVTPTAKGGVPLTHIPLHGIRDLDVAPLQAVAEINLAHYRNTAKLEDLVDVIGSPNLHIDVGETTVREWKESNAGEFKLGSRIGTITKGGRLDIVQAEERPLIRTVREDKESQLAAIGAAIVTRGGQAETAEAARIRAGSETSVLSNVVTDLSEDIEAALKSMATFAGYDTDLVSYSLNHDFFEAGIDAQLLQAIIAGRILYGSDVALHMIREGKVELPDGVTNEKILESAASVMPDGSQM